MHPKCAPQKSPIRVHLHQYRAYFISQAFVSPLLKHFLIVSHTAFDPLCKRFLRFGFIRVLSVQSPALCMRFYIHSQEFFPLRASSRFSSLFDAHRGFQPVRAHAHFCGKAIGHSVFDQPCNRVGLNSKLSDKAIVFREIFFEIPIFSLTQVIRLASQDRPLRFEPDLVFEYCL